MSDRTPYDGEPYYCALCDAGLGEFYACELPDCDLETQAQARARQQRQLAEAPVRRSSKSEDGRAH